MRYLFSKPDFRNLKGNIAERLVENYIEKNVIPTLRKNWDEVIFTPLTRFGDEIEENKHRPSYMKIFWRHEEKFFTMNNLMPTQDMLNKFRKLTKSLENVPDGFIIKVKKTGEFKRLSEALEELNLSNESWSEGSYTFNYGERNHNELLPLVDGDIEVIEVKCDKSIIPPHQKKSYGNALREGYLIRFFHVDMSNFTKNEFEIEEKPITNPDELATFPVKPKRQSLGMHYSSARQGLKKYVK